MMRKEGNIFPDHKVGLDLAPYLANNETGCRQAMGQFPSCSLNILIKLYFQHKLKAHFCQGLFFTHC